MAKTKTKKFRRTKTHGRGKKAGRGAGLRGGRGNAGLHKHRYATTVIWENQGYRHFGRVGFKRPARLQTHKATANVGSLDERYPGEGVIDLAAAGVDKLLGAGNIGRAVTVRVAEATPGAVAKVEAAGGRVELLSQAEA
jgi:large subunit ribosomal protein L15